MSHSRGGSLSQFEDLSLDDLEDDPIDNNAAETAEGLSSPKSISTSPTNKLASPSSITSPSKAFASWRGSTDSSALSNAEAGPSRLSAATYAASSSRPPMSKLTSNSSIRTASIKDLEGVPLVLGVAVVDFNHLIGPTVEFAYPSSLQAALTDDDELNRLVPFLALPDGAHLSEEDYSYFHCNYKPSSSAPTPSDDEIEEGGGRVPGGTTLFGISCNRQIAAADLLVRPGDVTRTTVQKAVVVFASQPVFGPIRDRLGVVTRAYFAQRDFTQTQILQDFYTSLEASLEGKSDESAIYMGTSLRELIHKFRHRTLLLLKMLMLQKRIMLFGYPVEMLCTYQYSLVSLMPGLLMSLRDCGAAELDMRTAKARPTSLRTSDRSSLLRFMGLPLHLFGSDSFFQPYLPLQQVGSLHARTWLVGTTNQIVTQSKEAKYDVLVNIENVSFEFSDPKMERLVALSPADRKWMDDVVKAVEDTWDLPEGERAQFRGSDDDLRSRFEEYICGALSSLKFAEFKAKAQAQDMSVVGVAGEENPLQPFGELWLNAFKETQAFEIWNACTDPVIFDISEPRHPCDGKTTLISDFGLRLTEGIHDLKLEQQLAPARETLSSAFTAGSTAFAAGSTSFWKTFDGVKNDIAGRLEAERARRAAHAAQAGQAKQSQTDTATPRASTEENGSDTPPATSNVSTPISTPQQGQATDIRATLGGIGSNIGSFFGSRVASLRGSPQTPAPEATKSGLRPMSLSPGSSTQGTGAKRRSG